MTSKGAAVRVVYELPNGRDIALQYTDLGIENFHSYNIKGSLFEREEDFKVQEIADFISEKVKAKGVLVIIKARHMKLIVFAD